MERGQHAPISKVGFMALQCPHHGAVNATKSYMSRSLNYSLLIRTNKHVLLSIECNFFEGRRVKLLSHLLRLGLLLVLDAAPPGNAMQATSEKPMSKM